MLNFSDFVLWWGFVWTSDIARVNNCSGVRFESRGCCLLLRYPDVRGAPHLGAAHPSSWMYGSPRMPAAYAQQQRPLDPEQPEAAGSAVTGSGPGHVRPPAQSYGSGATREKEGFRPLGSSLVRPVRAGLDALAYPGRAGMEPLAHPGRAAPNPLALLQTRFAHPESSWQHQQRSLAQLQVCT